MEGIEKLTQSKRDQWNQERRIVDRIVDGLGQGIDEDIKDLVIGLRLIGFHTTQSHAGNIQRCAFPYIDIESPQNDDLYRFIENEEIKLRTPEQHAIIKEQDEYYARIDAAQTDSELDAIHSHLDSLDERLAGFSVPKNPIIDTYIVEILRNNRVEYDKLQIILKDFNRTRVHSGATLMVDILGHGRSRLQCVDSKKQNKEKDDREKRLRLVKFQQEFADFSQFVKNKFFSNNLS